MVSILSAGHCYYDFPKTQKLGAKLKDVLESNVDERYYLSDAAVQVKLNTNFVSSKLESVIPKNGIMPTLLARDFKDPKCIIESDFAKGFVNINGKDYPITKNTSNYIEWKREGFLKSDCRAWDEDKLVGTLTTNGKAKVLRKGSLKNQLCDYLIQSGALQKYDVIRHSYSTNRMQGQRKDIRQNNISPTLDTRCDCLGVVTNTCRIRRLTPKECFRLMGVKDKDFERIAKNQSNASLYHLAGDSIVVDVLMAIFKEML